MAGKLRSCAQSRRLCAARAKPARQSERRIARLGGDRDIIFTPTRAQTASGPRGGRRSVSMGPARPPLRGAGNEWSPNARRDVLPRPGSAQKIGPKSLAWQRRKASASGGHLGFGLHPCAGRHVQLDAVEYGLFAQGFGQVEIETGF